MGVLHLLLRTRSVSRTAEILGVSQPTVSRCLAQLRRRLGDPLLVKNGKGMLLTHRAEQLCHPLQERLAHGRSFLAPTTFAPGEVARDFRVASTDFGALRIIRPILGRMMREAPHCAISVKPLDGASMRHLANAELDLVITGTPPAGSVYAKRLFAEALTLLVRKDHPLVVRDSPPCVEELVEWPHVLVTVPELRVDWLGDALRHRRLEPRHAVRTASFTLVPHLVAGSDAVATLPTSAAVEFARVHDMAILKPPIALGSVQYHLVWHERSRKDASISWLIRLLAGDARPLPC